MTEEGYIKFRCEAVGTERILDAELKEINEWREKLRSFGLIGVYPDGVGFGNISVRSGRHFIITGSGTGGLSALKPEHCAKVVFVDFDRNFLKYIGPIKPSSESMTHAAVYMSSPETNAVIHIHDLGMWKKLAGKVPTTGESAKYGTPEMAFEVMRILKAGARKKGMIVLGGHREGILSFGKNLEQAVNIILKNIG
jgi:ribulose-5-phosphate 4-epimerase/fuculose-1-phosphate aldolase